MPVRKEAKQPEPTIIVFHTGSTKSLSQKSNLSFDLGKDQAGSIQIRVTGNDGGGYWNNTWYSVADLVAALKKQSPSTPLSSIHLNSVIRQGSSNTSPFVFSCLASMGLLEKLPKKARSYKLIDPDGFLQKIETLAKAPSKTTSKKRSARKTSRKLLNDT